MLTISINPLIFIGPFVIRWSILIVLIATGIGVWLAAHEAERKGIKKDDVYSVAIWIVIAGIVGTRLFYVINLWSFEFSLNPVRSLYIFHDWGFDIWEPSLADWWQRPSYAGNVVGACLFFWMQLLRVWYLPKQLGGSIAS